MTIGELWPQLRPLCRALALLGWVSSAAGMTAGLSIAVASGTSLSPTMVALQLVSASSMGLAIISFVLASLLQPQHRGWHGSEARAGSEGWHGPEARAASEGWHGSEGRAGDAGQEPSGELPPTIKSFLLGSFALLAGAVAFACAGLILRSGPSAQTVAFCQVFLLGAAASGFTFMLFSKVAPPDRT